MRLAVPKLKSSIPEHLFCNRSSNAVKEKAAAEKGSIDSQKKIYYENSSNYRFFPAVMMAVTFLISLNWMYPNLFRHTESFPDFDWTKRSLGLVPFYCFLLMALYFAKWSKYSLMVNTVSAVVLIKLVVMLEIVFQRRECLVAYLIMVVIFRMIERRTLYDAFAICVAYTSDIVSINRDQFNWYYTSNLFVWTYFLVAILLSHLFRRLAYRVWEHVRVLVILREKSRQERRLGDSLITSHMPDEVVSHLFPLKEFTLLQRYNSQYNRTSVNLVADSVTRHNSISSQSTYNSEFAVSPPAPVVVKEVGPPKTKLVELAGVPKKKTLNGRMFIKAGYSRSPTSKRPATVVEDDQRSTRSGTSSLSVLLVKTGTKDSVLRAVARSNIVSPFADGLLSASQLETIGGLDRRDMVLIAIKPDLNTSESSAFTHLQMHELMELIDYLADLHRITRIRMFGNTWVGCLGAFQSYESAAVNCQHASVFASEVSVVARHLYGNVSYAMEFGRVLCGYVNSVNFDLFGQEIRWVLMMVELKQQFGKIALGEAAKKQLQLYRKQALESNAFNVNFDKPTIHMGQVAVATLEHIACDQPWAVDAKVSVHYIANAGEMIDERILNANLEYYFTTTKEFRYAANVEEATAAAAVLVAASETASPPPAASPPTQLILGSPSSPRNRIHQHQQQVQQQIRQQHQQRYQQVPRRSQDSANPGQSSRRSPTVAMPIVDHSQPQSLGSDIGDLVLNAAYEAFKKVEHYLEEKEEVVACKPISPRVDWFKFQTVLYGDTNFHNLMRTMNINQMGSSSRSIALQFPRTAHAPLCYVGIEDRMGAARKQPLKYSIIRNKRDTRADNNRAFDELTKNSVRLGVEFLTTTYERFGVRLDDPVLDGMSPEELARAHKDVEAEVYKIVYSQCFRSYPNALLMINQYTNIHGRNEYQESAAWRGAKSRASRVAQSIVWAWDQFWACFTFKASPASLYEERVKSGVSEVDFPEGYRGRYTSLPDSGVESFRSRVDPSPMASYSSHRTLVAPGKVHVTNVGSADAMDIEMAPRRLQMKKPSPIHIPNSNMAPTGAAPVDRSQKREEAKQTISEELYSIYRACIRSKRIIGMLDAMAIKHSLDDTVAGGEDNEEDDELMQRSWMKYHSDARLFTRSLLFNFLISVVLTGVSLYAVKNSVFHSQSNPFYVLLVGAVHLFLPHIVERRYDRIVYVILLLFGVFLYIFIPNNALCTDGDYRYQTSKDELDFGDQGGDVTVLLLLAFRIAAQLRHSAWISCMDWITARVLLVNGRCHLTSSSLLMFFCFNFQLLLLYQLLEHRCFVSFLVEHKMVPYAHKAYLEQKHNSRRLLQVFTPGVPSSTLALDFFTPRTFHNCSIVAIHLKAPDILSAIIQPQDLVVVMKTLYTVIDGCIEDCGMLKVTQFSGMVVAVACKDLRWDQNVSLSGPENYQARAAELVKRLQDEIEKFNNKYEFNLALGMGVNHGSVSLGFQGGQRYCFDVSGEAVDIACAMASYHGDRVFMRDTREDRSIKDPDLTSAAVLKLASGDWYPIGDVKLQGIGLDDFDYLRMLGKGGYGSVHLVEERVSKDKYAIKVIALTSGPIMPKMITRECIILQMMQHPNVLSLEAAFTHRERLYLVMKYIRGGTLKEILEYEPNRGVIKADTKRLWFAELVLAIEYVHTMGIIHRDVKPANCMIGTDGHLRLADFGLSKKVSGPEVPLMNTGADVNTSDLDHMALRVKHRVNPVADLLGLTKEAFFKIQTFLPLKLSNKPHRLVIRLLYVTRHPPKDDPLYFRGFSVELTAVDGTQAALTRFQKEQATKEPFNAVVIDVDHAYPQPVEEGELEDLEEDHPRSKWNPSDDGLRLVSDFMKSLKCKVTVLVMTSRMHGHQYKLPFIKMGVQEFMTKPPPEVEERTYRTLFGIPEPEAEVPCEVVITPAPPPDPTPAPTVAALTMATHAILPDAQTVNALLEKSNQKSKSLAHSAVGTMHFIAPEVLKMSKYGKPVDWWACGITIYECLVGEHLFLGDDRSGLASQITSSGSVNLTKLRAHGDASVRLVSGLLTKEVKYRLGTDNVESIKSHDFFKGLDWLTISTSQPDYLPRTFEHVSNPNDIHLFRGEAERGGLKSLVAASRLYYDAIDQDFEDIASVSSGDSGSVNHGATRKQYSSGHKIQHHKSRHRRAHLPPHHRIKGNMMGQRNSLLAAPHSEAKTKMMEEQQRMFMTDQFAEQYHRRSRRPSKVDVNSIREESEEQVREEDLPVCAVDFTAIVARKYTMQEDVLLDHVSEDENEGVPSASKDEPTPKAMRAQALMPELRGSNSGQSAVSRQAESEYLSDFSDDDDARR